MFRTKYSDKVTWLGVAVNDEIKPATYKGNYFVICKKCPCGLNYSSRIGSVGYKKRDFTIQLRANQIENFKRKHDVLDGHKWTILHESIVPKYVSKQMIGDKECLIVAV